MSSLADFNSDKAVETESNGNDSNLDREKHPPQTANSMRFGQEEEINNHAISTLSNSIGNDVENHSKEKNLEENWRDVEDFKQEKEEEMGKEVLEKEEEEKKREEDDEGKEVGEEGEEVEEKKEEGEEEEKKEEEEEEEKKEEDKSIEIIEEKEGEAVAEEEEKAYIDDNEISLSSSSSSNDNSLGKESSLSSNATLSADEKLSLSSASQKQINRARFGMRLKRDVNGNVIQRDDSYKTDSANYPPDHVSDPRVAAIMTRLANDERRVLNRLPREARTSGKEYKERVKKIIVPSKRNPPLSLVQQYNQMVVTRGNQPCEGCSVSTPFKLRHSTRNNRILVLRKFVGNKEVTDIELKGRRIPPPGTPMDVTSIMVTT